MPEGDTVHLTADRLDAAISGRTLTRTDFRVPRFATTDLSGRVITEVDAYGKHIFMRTDDAITVHSHLKMEGAWHVYAHGRRWRAPAHDARVVLETDDVVAVGFRLGAAIPWPERQDEAQHRPGRKAGASIVVIDGELFAYLEKGGKSMIVYDDDEARARTAFIALAGSVRGGRIPAFTLERVDGKPLPAEGSLVEAALNGGFVHTPKGIRIRG